MNFKFCFHHIIELYNQLFDVCDMKKWLEKELLICLGMRKGNNQIIVYIPK